MTRPNRYERIPVESTRTGQAPIGQPPIEKARIPAHPSLQRGFSSLDSLFSILPIMLMVTLALSMASYLSKGTAERAQRQMLFDKLVEIADYTIKSGAVVRDGSVRYPNWIEPGLLGQDFTAGLKDKAGLRRLLLSISEDKGMVEDAGADGDTATDEQTTTVDETAMGLSAGSDSPSDMCICRLVVVGPSKEIRRLIVCGS
jgi:hypothetical protein